MQVGVSITLAQLLVVERDSRVADAVLMAHARSLLGRAGSRAGTSPTPRPSATKQAPFLRREAEFDNVTVRAPSRNPSRFPHPLPVAPLSAVIDSRRALRSAAVDHRMRATDMRAPAWAAAPLPEREASGPRLPGSTR